MECKNSTEYVCALCVSVNVCVCGYVFQLDTWEKAQAAQEDGEWERKREGRLAVVDGELRHWLAAETNKPSN